MAHRDYVIGIDFGTDSVRTLIVDARNGEETATSVRPFSRWSEGRYCDPAKNRFRQHPADHIESLERTVQEALKQAPPGASGQVRGISVDTTGSTPGPVNREGVPLAILPEFDENPNAMFILWKDHTSVAEAEEINRVAHSWGGMDFTMYEGGIYSSEWFWAKILHVLREDEKIREAAFSWVEHCDWVTALLTGKTDPLRLKRSRCAAGHKAMWHQSFGGLPSEEFLIRLDPLLSGLRGRLYTETFTSDSEAGNLSPKWAERLGLPAGIPVGVGAFDAHMGAVGGGIRPYYLSKVIGTSTCDILVAPMEEMGGKLVKGICGQVDGSVIPGMLGMEAGQSGFGDIYAWFREVILWPVRNLAGSSLDTEEMAGRVIPELSRAAEKTPLDVSGAVALDWMNGRRTPDANQALKGAVTGLNLGSTAPVIFRALVEATAFGSRKIVERFESEGVPIKEIIALGGVAKKSPFVMQTLADVHNRPIKVARSEQACALGAAMFAAVAGGIYKTVEEAVDAMESGFEDKYIPNLSRAEIYSTLYNRYCQFGEFIEQETMGKREKTGTRI
ncbi:MAG: ribulokinase [Candidatus Latescibacter sp.]|nr:ribulokinase [Candidatus Latescibacter sp.]